MKYVIILAKKSKDHKGLLAIENIDKITIAEIAKVLNTIDLHGKYNWAISNGDINAAEDLRLTNIKNYQKGIGKIQDKIDWLHRNWISALKAIIKYSQKMHNNEKIIKNIMIRHKIDLEWVSSLFV